MTNTNEQIQETLKTIQMVKDVLEVDGGTAREIYFEFRKSDAERMKSDLELRIFDLRIELKEEIKKLTRDIEVNRSVSTDIEPTHTSKK